MPVPLSPLPAHAFDQKTFRDVREAIRADPALAMSLQRLLYPDAATTMLARLVEPPPMTGIMAIEATIADNGSKPPPKDTRKGRIAARWHVTLQVFTRASKGLEDPAWKGFCRLATPERALSDALRLSNPKKCRTPFSSQFCAELDGVAEQAEQEGWLIGFLYSKPSDGGTFYHQRHLLLVPDPALAAPDYARLLLVQDEKMAMIELPSFVRVTSTGKPLPRTFVLQSRGATSADHYVDWRTGNFHVSRK